MKKFHFIILFFQISINFCSAQTLEGTSGLFFIPTAEMQYDKQFTIGVHNVHKSLISFRDYKLNAVVPFFSFNFLPFVEISAKITRTKRTENDTQGIGDRTISLRIRFVDEKEFIPGIVFGLHDLAGIYGGPEAVRNNALYIVSSKHFSIKDPKSFGIGIHAGYGLDKIKAQHHNFVGLFGGLSLKLFNTLELMTEYDGKHSNSGMRLKLFNHLSILGGFLQHKHFSGGASFSFIL